jgi:hypothetical protein
VYLAPHDDAEHRAEDQGDLKVEGVPNIRASIATTTMSTAPRS